MKATGKIAICITSAAILLALIHGCASRPTRREELAAFTSAHPAAVQNRPVATHSAPSPAPPARPSASSSNPVAGGGIASKRHSGIPASASVTLDPHVRLVPWSPTAPSPGFIEYQVKRGDTLAGLARQFLGSPNHWRSIYNHNQQVIGDPDNLQIGATLRIPSTP